MNNYIHQIITGVFILMVCACRIGFLKTSALPSSKMSISKELLYLVQTDQADRKHIRPVLFFGKRKILALQERDLERSRKVAKFYDMDSVKTDNDKLNAGLIFLHSPDSSFRKRAYDIYCDLEKNGTTDIGKKQGSYWKKIIEGF